MFLTPSVQPSTAGKTGLSAPPVRARSERSEIGELGARRFFRGAQGIPLHTTGVQWGQPPGPPFFWFVFFGEAKKMNSPQKGETRKQKSGYTSPEGAKHEPKRNETRTERTKNEPKKARHQGRA